MTISPTISPAERLTLTPTPIPWPASEVPTAYYAPSDPQDLAQTIALAHQHHWTIGPCGQGTKLTWGNAAAPPDLWLSTSHLDRLIDHAAGDLTITAQAGMPLATLQGILAQQNQFLPLDPPSAATCTLGGLIATGDSGPLRQGYGGVRDLLLGIDFVRYDGQAVKAGGRVVKNVAGYDLMKLFTGSFGTLGILTQVTFRVYPLPGAYRTVLVQGASVPLGQIVQRLLASSLTPIAFEFLNGPRCQQHNLGSSPALLVRFGSVPASVVAQAEQLVALAQDLSQSRSQDLSTKVLGDETASEEAALWQALGANPTLGPGSLVCKVGLVPSAIAPFLIQLAQISPNASAQLRAGIGLGLLALPPETSIQVLERLRQHCETAGGFLTILEAPDSLKTAIDPWGYPGNALPVMREIKQRFDPQNALNPGRFVV